MISPSNVRAVSAPGVIQCFVQLMYVSGKNLCGLYARWARATILTTSVRAAITPGSVRASYGSCARAGKSYAVCAYDEPVLPFCWAACVLCERLANVPASYDSCVRASKSVGVLSVCYGGIKRCACFGRIRCVSG